MENPSNTSTGMTLPPRNSAQIKGARLGGRIKTLETWFDEDPQALDGYDLLICHQRSKPLAPRRWMYFYTILIDLTLEPEELFNKMNKTTIKEIKRAKDKDKLVYFFIDSPKHHEIEEFSSLFDMHPRTKEQLPIDRNRLHTLNEIGLLRISKIQTQDGTNLIWRCNLAHESQRRVQPLFAASLHHASSEREIISLVGRANRLLHYSEMLHFKNQGFLLYDFNGWYAGVDDEKRLQINRFKEGFGGRIVYGYDCEEPLTLGGWVYIILRAIKQRLFQPDEVREIRRRRQKAPRLSETDPG
jgi:hypothetical protein